MTTTFEGKVVLITGAASGIGRVAALTFGREGARVIVSDLVAEGGQETAQMITRAGGHATFIRADVTAAAEVEALIKQVERLHGRLDIALNNAGIDGVHARTADYPPETWAEVLNVNLTGVFLCMKYEIPLMIHQQGGAIVNVSSVAGVTGFPSHCAYTASKHGVIGLTRTAALEYAKTGLRVNAICPTYTQTPMLQRMLEAKPEFEARLKARVPLGRLGTPEEIVAAVLYLCSDSAAFITGHALVLDGGIMAE
jgi:NAD(P)-dependent dehydrogenase (short-subunit alcohol dehydrogenase family)